MEDLRSHETELLREGEDITDGIVEVGAVFEGVVEGVFGEFSGLALDLVDEGCELETCRGKRRG